MAMKENDYVKVGNLVKLQAMRCLLREILPGDEFGIGEEAFRNLAAELEKSIAGVAVGVSIK